MPPRKRKAEEIAVDSHNEESDNEEMCNNCGYGGDLICCDDCPKVFHLDCLKPPLYKAPRGSWKCAECTLNSKRKGVSVDNANKSDSSKVKVTGRRVMKKKGKDYSSSGSDSTNEEEEEEEEESEEEEVVRTVKVAARTKGGKPSKKTKREGAPKPLVDAKYCIPDEPSTDINHSLLLSVAVLLSLLKGPLKLKRQGVETLEEGLRDPSGGLLNEVFTKLLVDPSLVQKALLIGESYDLEWWGTKLKLLVSSWYEKVEACKGVYEALKAYSDDVKEEDIVNAKLEVVKWENLTAIIGKTNPFVSEESSFTTITLKERLAILISLCEWRMNESPLLLQVLRDTPQEDLRVEPFGYDQEGRGYYLFRTITNDCRLYRSVPKKKGVIDCICSNVSEMENFTKTLGKKPLDKAVCKYVEAYLDEYRETFEKREKERLRNEKKMILLDAPRKRSSRIEAKLPEILPNIQVESESEKRLQKEKKREALRQKVMDHMRDSAFTCVSKEEIDKEVERIEKQQLIEERLRLRKEKEEEQRLAEEAAAIAEQKEKEQQAALREERLRRRKLGLPALTMDEEMVITGGKKRGNEDQGFKRKRFESDNPFFNSLPWKMQRCAAVLEKLSEHELSEPFMKPVDAVALGIPHYHTIVTKPMDISTVREKLHRGEYTSQTQFNEDVHLIFSNCILFNHAKSQITQFATQLNEWYTRLYKQWVSSQSYDTEGEWDEIMKKLVNEGCRICGRGSYPDKLIYCDLCEREYHIQCLSPPLGGVPKDEWFCPGCIEGRRDEVEEKKKAFLQQRLLEHQAKERERQARQLQLQQARLLKQQKLQQQQQELQEKQMQMQRAHMLNQSMLAQYQYSGVPQFQYMPTMSAGGLVMKDNVVPHQVPPMQQFLPPSYQHPHHQAWMVQNQQHPAAHMATVTAGSGTPTSQPVITNHNSIPSSSTSTVGAVASVPAVAVSVSSGDAVVEASGEGVAISGVSEAGGEPGQAFKFEDEE